ncbi:MAG: hypothetical protein QT11_C0001G0192 [archaeon GW2011_AR20]|nr:MAG: hypothetical protein QT11_C0001G0192 [archaeon GW2011_AR20]MBS3160643.1 hypothetical protein [Candidatus Woesearchaeota archaeon]
MVSNTNTISGAAMSVLLGVIIIIAPWVLNLGFSYKFILGLFGIFLIWVGVKH